MVNRRPSLTSIHVKRRNENLSWALSKSLNRFKKHFLWRRFSFGSESLYRLSLIKACLIAINSQRVVLQRRNRGIPRDLCLSQRNNSLRFRGIRKPTNATILVDMDVLILINKLDYNLLYILQKWWKPLLVLSGKFN